MSIVFLFFRIMVPTASVGNTPLISKHLSAYEYACQLRYYQIADMIRQRSKFLPFEQRFVRVLQSNDVRRCDTFLQHLRNEKRQEHLAKEGMFFAAELGSVRLLDYFLTRWKIDINLQQSLNKDFSTTPVLTAITHNQSEAAKFLLFRRADPSLKGQYDNALVTALHFQASNDLIRLLLDKHVDITARHPDYKKLSLREYCIATNRVKAKMELDAYILRLINDGKYKRLKWLVDHGYKHINVYISHRRYGRNLARERYHERIVKLIDDLEVAQKRAKQKMNY